MRLAVQHDRFKIETTGRPEIILFWKNILFTVFLRSVRLILQLFNLIEISCADEESGARKDYLRIT